LFFANFSGNAAGGLMKNYQKTILICVVILFCAANPVFSQNTINIENLQASNGALDRFIYYMNLSLPFNSTMGLNWSDAYIGPSPPHFGIGITTGFTTMNFTSISELMGKFGLGLTLDNADTFQNIGLPVPGYTVEARIGVTAIPLDFGLKFGYLPPGIFDSLMGTFSSKQAFGFKNMLIGVDARYALLIKKVSPLRFSVGAGFNYMEGAITAELPDNLSFAFYTPEGNNFYKETKFSTTDDSQLGIVWRTLTLELKMQASFSFKIITPYAGVGASYAFSWVGYRVEESKTDNSYAEELKSLGLTDVSETSFESIKRLNSFNVRAFGGLSFNLALFRLDLTGMYNIRGGNLGATIGFRFQL
jgi:hypothetical protein